MQLVRRCMSASAVGRGWAGPSQLLRISRPQPRKLGWTPCTRGERLRNGRGHRGCGSCTRCWSWGFDALFKVIDGRQTWACLAGVLPGARPPGVTPARSCLGALPAMSQGGREESSPLLGNESDVDVSLRGGVAHLGQEMHARPVKTKGMVTFSEASPGAPRTVSRMGPRPASLPNRAR